MVHWSQQRRRYRVYELYGGNYVYVGVTSRALDHRLRSHLGAARRAGSGSPCLLHRVLADPRRTWKIRAVGPPIDGPLHAARTRERRHLARVRARGGRRVLNATRSRGYGGCHEPNRERRT